MATGKKCKLSHTKVTTRKKKKSPSQSLVAAASQTDNLANLPSSSSEGNFPKIFSYACIHLDTNHAIHSNYQDIPKDQSEGEEEDTQSTPPPSSSNIQVLICSLSKYFKPSHDLECGLLLDPIRCSILPRLPGNPEQILH